MMIITHIGSMMATARMHDAGARMFNVNEARFGLANKAGADMTFGDVARLAQQDKALALQGIQAQTHYLVAQAMLEAAERRKQQDRELKQRLMDAGAVFV